MKILRVFALLLPLTGVAAAADGPIVVVYTDSGTEYVGRLDGASKTDLVLVRNGHKEKIALGVVKRVVFGGPAEVAIVTPQACDQSAGTTAPNTLSGAAPATAAAPSTSSPTSTATTYSGGGSSSSGSSSSGGTVQVKGHTRKDGTYVPPHTRKAPRRRN